MNKTKTITATEASRSFSELLHRVCYCGESFIIKKGNREMARIGPVAQELEKAKSSATIKDDPIEALEELPTDVTPEEAEYFKAVMDQLRKKTPETA